MKTKLHKLCLIIFLTMISMSSKAEIIIAISDKGNWNENSTWNLDRLPICGDTIYIPSGIEVKISENVNFERNNFNIQAMQLIVFGTLSFNSGKYLNLSPNSTLIIDENGEINKKNLGKKANSFISIHLIKIWNSKHGNITEAQILGQEVSSSQDLFDFEVLNIKDTLLISWKIKQFDEIGYYELFVSNNGKNWESIKKMKAIHNDSIEKMLCHIHKSSKTDKNLYFKLDACDLNGKTTILALTKSKRKVDYTKALTTIPKILIRSTIFVFLTSIDTIK